MSLFSKPQSFLGIDLGAGGIKLVELRKDKNRPVLFTYGLTSLAQDIHQLTDMNNAGARKEQPITLGGTDNIIKDSGINLEQVDKYVAVVKAVCAKAKTVSKIARVSLPVSAVFHAIINLPATVRKEEMLPILKAEVQKFSSRSVDTLAIDYQPLPQFSNERTTRVLVNAVPKNLILFFTTVFKKAGLTLDALEPESVAVARSLVGRDSSVTMIVDMGAERTNFFIIDQGVVMTHHSIEDGGNRVDNTLERVLGLEETQVEMMKRDLFAHLLQDKSSEKKEKFSELFMPVIDPILKEIEYSFDLYLRQSGNETKRPEKIILTGGAAFLPYLSQILADKFKLRCYLGDPWGRVLYQDSLKPVLHDVGPRLAVAIGLALRSMV